MLARVGRWPRAAPVALVAQPDRTLPISSTTSARPTAGLRRGYRLPQLAAVVLRPVQTGGRDVSRGHPGQLTVQFLPGRDGKKVRSSAALATIDTAQRLDRRRAIRCRGEMIRHRHDPQAARRLSARPASGTHRRIKRARRTLHELRLVQRSAGGRGSWYSRMRGSERSGRRQPLPEAGHASGILR